MNEVMDVVHRFAPKNFAPKVGMVLGSGLSSIAEQLTDQVAIPFQAIPGLPTGSVAGHASLLVLGKLGDVPVVCLRGRLHLYEGVSHESVRILVRLVKLLGCQTFIVTGAAGSLREDIGAGEVMMIQDHINFQPFNPLMGPNDESMGPRFFAMEDAYDAGLQDVMMNVAKRQHIELHKGVYISVLGPSFETAAEIRAFKQWGADAVGMSVVPEVLIARHCGMRVACLAAITNLATGLSKEKISHEGTLQFGAMAARKLVKLIPEFVKEVGKNGVV